MKRHRNRTFQIQRIQRLESYIYIEKNCGCVAASHDLRDPPVNEWGWVIIPGVGVLLGGEGLGVPNSV